MATLGSRCMTAGGMVLALFVILSHITLSGAGAPEANSAPKAEGSRVGDERDDNGLKLKLIWCPPGRFTMGSAAAEEGRDTDEEQVAVGLSDGFWLGKFEVTQSEWKQVMNSEPWKGRPFVKEGDDYPATHVSRDDALIFCRVLTTQERKAGRMPARFEYSLPTEAQWEYACRAGTATRFSFGDETLTLSDHAWWGGTGPWGNIQDEAYAHRVGLKRPNPWGLFDMHGNVWEWCRDAYGRKLAGGDDPEAAVATREDGLAPWRGPCHGADCIGRSTFVLRGGSWFRADHYCRSAFRFRFPRRARLSELGFRLALSEVP